MKRMSMLICQRSVLIRQISMCPLRTAAISDARTERLFRPWCRHWMPALRPVMSHLGRPTQVICRRTSLAPVADHLSGLLDRPVHERLDRRRRGRAGELVLCENVRFLRVKRKTTQNWQ